MLVVMKIFLQRYNLRLNLYSLVSNLRRYTVRSAGRAYYNFFVNYTFFIRASRRVKPGQTDQTTSTLSGMSNLHSFNSRRTRTWRMQINFTTRRNLASICNSRMVCCCECCSQPCNHKAWVSSGQGGTVHSVKASEQESDQVEDAVGC